MIRGTTNRIEDCAKYVHEALQDDPAKAHSIFEGLVAEFEEPVADWDDARETEAGEHHGTVGSPGGGSEFVDPRDGYASNSEDTYLWVLEIKSLPGIMKQHSTFIWVERCESLLTRYRYPVIRTG